MNRPVALFIVLILSAGLHAQTGTLTGTLKDRETGKPVPFASVWLWPDGRNRLTAATDLDGKYKLEKIPDGKYSLTARAVGYDSSAISGISIKGPVSLKVDLEMMRIRASYQEIVPIPLYVPKPASSQPKQIIDLSRHWGKEENFPLSQIGKSISYVPLETNKECFLPQAASCGLRLTPDYILVITAKRPILVFSRQGKYLWKIGEIGNGPHETPEISNVVANQEKDWVAIRSSATDKVMLFSMKGLFLREFDLQPGTGNIYPGPDGEIVGLSMPVPGTSDSRRSLIFYSDKGMILNRMEVFENKEDPIEAYSWRFETSLFWKNGLPGIIEHPFTEAYLLDASGQWLSEWQIKDEKDEKITILSAGYVGDYLMISAANPGVHTFVASLHDGEVSRCSFSINLPGPNITGLYNDLDGGLPFRPASRIERGEVAAMYDAGHLIDYAKGDLPTYGGKAPEMRQRFRDLTAKLTHEDNPVVVLLTLR